ncbi:unnamed protein product [Nippostrongylus brasiliensis]|uniref:SPARC_Ca_bdg domain-containing protein n=1 Tax=Nippostrongylus brasiliensis TaxID=27835 RepID=A0A0N4XVK7_NIPBR|nr:unnamed protein product [Nippostrongylus brasiliensis]
MLLYYWQAYNGKMPIRFCMKFMCMAHPPRSFQNAHKIACRNDVAWMFEQWDGDENGLLTKEELMPLEGNGREQCVAQFIDMCDDMVVDGNISVDEWCDCFSFADDLRHEPPCHKQKHSVDPHMAGEANELTEEDKSDLSHRL